MIDDELINKIFNKIGKANLNNVLNISDIVKDNFNDFCIKFLNKCSNNTLLFSNKCKIISELIFKYQMLYNNVDYKYNKQMIVDNFFMELCSAMR